MSTMFQKVKAAVDIIRHAEKITCSRSKSVGDHTRRLGPCPFCGHFGCCTLNGKDQYFRCFSCGARGDVIEFERRFRGFNRAMDAVKSIAQAYGIPIDGTSTPKPTQKPEPPPEPREDQWKRHL